MRVGNLVRTVKRIHLTHDHVIDPSEIGIIVQVWEPTIQYPRGAAEIRYSGDAVTLFWEELEVLSEGR